MNLVMLMAGPSDAFLDAGHIYPKNLLEIEGLPLTERVLENVEAIRASGAQLICAINSDEQRQFHTADVIRLIDPKAAVIEVRGTTSGAACTALLAAEYINNDEPLVITNGDQILEADLMEVIRSFQERDLGAGTIVFDAVHPRWSYVRLDQNGLVEEAAEKRPISRHATAGFYYFKRGRDFVAGAFAMIEKNAHVGGRFYVCPVFNELILKQQKVGVFEISRDQYFSLANPDSVQLYAQHLARK